LAAVGRVGARREGCGITRVRPSWEAALLYRLAVDKGCGRRIRRTAC
jgi:hypothetical protein